jgi:hypothetical protein
MLKIAYSRGVPSTLFLVLASLTGCGNAPSPPDDTVSTNLSIQAATAAAQPTQPVGATAARVNLGVLPTGAAATAGVFAVGAKAPSTDGGAISITVHHN